MQQSTLKTKLAMQRYIMPFEGKAMTLSNI